VPSFRVGLILLLTVANGLTVAASLPVAAATPAAVQQDPVVGPNAQDEARHAHDLLSLAPARTAIQPLQRRASAPLNRAGIQGAVTNPAGGVDREVLGFAPYWEISSNANWNYSLLTTVAYFGLDFMGDGSFNNTTGGWTGWNSQNLVDTINRAHAAGDRVVVVVKSFDDATINQIVSSPTATQAAITNTINAIASKNLDGVNIDFEGSINASYPNLQSGFSAFVRALSTQVHQRWSQANVTVDTYSGSASWDGGFFKIGDLAPSVDAIFVMAYDMVFSNSPGHAGPNAPLNGWTYNDTGTVAQYLTKAPASKILLGVPYYGYKWDTADQSAYAATSGTVQSDTYAGALSDLSCGAQQLGTAWDSIAASPWASWYSPATNDPCGGNHGSWRELYYENAFSLGDKYDLVNNSNLLGTGMWALGYDGTSSDLWNELKVKFGNPWPGQFHVVPPTRIYDSRISGGPLGPGQTRTIAIAGQPGVPVPANGAAGVVLNVTVTGPTAAGYLTVFPAGTPRPPISNVSVRANITVATLTESTLGRDGAVGIYNASGSTDVVVDLAGWISIQGNDADTTGLYRPLVPARLLDTRSGLQPARVGPGQTIDVPVLSQGVPGAGVSAVALNLTATNASTATYLTVFPTGGTPPTTSNLNLAAGQTVPNRVIAAVGTGGKVSVYNRGGSVDLVVDVGGWFTDASDPAATGGRFTGIPAARIVDTRLGGPGIPQAPLRAGAPLGVQAAGVGGVPAMSAAVPPRAVLVNVTATDSTASSFLTVYPSDASMPASSDLNWAPGTTVSNLVLAKLGSDGHLLLLNGIGTTDVVIDVLGWYN